MRADLGRPPLRGNGCARAGGGRSRARSAALLVAVLAAIASGSGEARAQVVMRVAPGGADVPDCGSAATPCRSIQQAVNRIAASGTVLVAGRPGGARYGFAPGLDPCSATLFNTAAVCVVNKQVVLRGGYPPGDWTTPDPDANPTIIDGGGVHRGVLAIGTGPVTSLEIEGVTIRNGRAAGTPGRPGLDEIYAFGGGLQADQVALLRVRRVVFEANEAIGDDVPGARPWATVPQFGGAGSGGGAALRWVADAVFEDVRFEGNRALGGAGPARGGYAVGGGLYAFESTVTGSGLVFRDNVSIAGSSAGSGIDSTGERADAFGGAASFQEGSTIVLERVSARDNAALGGSSALAAGGAFGGAFKLEGAALRLSHADLRGNLAAGGTGLDGWLGNGGAIEAIHSSTTLERVTMVGNVARGGDGTSGNKGAAGGGAVNATWFLGADSTLVLRHSVVAGNRVESGAGTVVTGGGGGGLWIQGTTATVEHVTIADNEVDGSMQGEAVLLLEAPVGSATARPAAAAFSWDVIARHDAFPSWKMAAVHVKRPGHASAPPNSLVARRLLFSQNSRDTNADGVPAAAGTFTVIAAPLAPATPGFAAPGAPSFDYHLLATSPARDQATGSTAAVDLDGDLRSAPDLGADEHAAAGGLSGHVRDASSQPLAGVLVEVFDAITRAPLRSATSGAGGAWSVAGIQQGAVRLRFSDPAEPRRFLPRWWQGRRDEGRSDTVVVASGATTTDVDATIDAPVDVVFVDDFESGDLSRWSQSATREGRLSVDRRARRHGSRGLRFDATSLPGPASRAKLWVKDTTPAGLSRYRARFLLDLDTLALPTSPRIVRLLAARTAGSPTLRPFELRLRFEDGTWRLYGVARGDVGTGTQTPPVVLARPGWSTIEVDWRRASTPGAADGSLVLRVGETEVAATAVANGSVAIDGVQLGLLGGVGTSASGTMFVDDFESRSRSAFAAP